MVLEGEYSSRPGVGQGCVGRGEGGGGVPLRPLNFRKMHQESGGYDAL